MSQNRRIGVALDFSATSKKALEWAIKNLLKDGDHLVLIMVNNNKHDYSLKTNLWEESGSPLIPYIEFGEPQLLKDYQIKHDIDVFNLLETVNRQKKLVIVAKVYWGDARDKLCDSATELSLDCLVLGSRGLGSLKSILLGSVSTYVLDHAPCPVTMVKLACHEKP